MGCAMGYLDDKGLAHLWGAIKRYVAGNAGGSIPPGGIIVWSGAADAVPSGWVLCDGNNGTPDLRDRFVLGAGTAHAVGEAGGEETHKLTVSEMPSHSHSVKAVKSGSSSAKSYCISQTYGGDAHTSTLTYGGGQPHNNMPPYHALCYIMKL